MEQSPSFLKDITDYLTNWKVTVSVDIASDAILFCFDVAKLYPSIPRKEGIEACIKEKEAFEQQSNPRINTKDALLLVETVLDNNYFSQGKKHFKQTELLHTKDKIDSWYG